MKTITLADRRRIVRQARLDYSALPEWARSEMQRYFEDAIAPGSGLRAAIENDLRRYVGYAFDDVDAAAFGAGTVALVRWLHNEMPTIAWGSAQAVVAWLSTREKAP